MDEEKVITKRKIFVGCSSALNIPDRYFDDCKKLLEKLFENGNELVFGACNRGLMGLSYNVAMENNSLVYGICPKTYKDDLKEIQCFLKLVDNVSERTQQMIEMSDILVFLPGGIGTIYELFTAIECKRTGEFDKPIVIYNSNGYYDGLFEFMEKMYGEGFSKIKDKDNYLISDSIDEIIDYINNYVKFDNVNKNTDNLDEICEEKYSNECDAYRKKEIKEVYEKRTAYEKRCLEILEDTANNFYFRDHYYYGKYAERRICINKRNNIWEVYCCLEGLVFFKNEFDNCFDACKCLINLCVPSDEIYQSSIEYFISVLDNKYRKQYMYEKNKSLIKKIKLFRL